MANLTNIKVKKNSIAIIGTDDGGAGNISSWLENCNYHVACFVNPNNQPIDLERIKLDINQRKSKTLIYPKRESFKDLPLIDSYKWTEKLHRIGIDKVLICTGSPKIKLGLINQAKKNGFTCINAIHPTTYIGRNTILNDNIITFANSVIEYGAEIKTGTRISTGVIISHHSRIGEVVDIALGCTVGAHTQIGKGAIINPGCTIGAHAKIGDYTILGAGSVVIKNIEDRFLAYGVPARQIKKLDD